MKLSRIPLEKIEEEFLNRGWGWGSGDRKACRMNKGFAMELFELLGDCFYEAVISLVRKQWLV